MKDIFGRALLDYQEGKKGGLFRVHCSIAELDEVPVAYFFRQLKKMPDIEKSALDLCRGKILDVGAAAGCHSIVLKENGMDVLPVDLSPGAVEVMHRRGLQQAQLIDFFDIRDTDFDTLLLLMNGAGVCGSLDGLGSFFRKADQLLAPGGQILLDSSDLIYMFEDEDGSVRIDLNNNYYGEVQYRFEYEGESDEPFRWLFVAYDLLEESAAAHGFSCELVLEGGHYDYLARLVRS